jgi:hypothetical protein
MYLTARITCPKILKEKMANWSIQGKGKREKQGEDGIPFQGEVALSEKGRE